MGEENADVHHADRHLNPQVGLPHVLDGLGLLLAALQALDGKAVLQVLHGLAKLVKAGLQQLLARSISDASVASDTTLPACSRKSPPLRPTTP